jgi:hypothetical protein
MSKCFVFFLFTITFLNQLTAEDISAEKTIHSPDIFRSSLQYQRLPITSDEGLIQSTKDVSPHLLFSFAGDAAAELATQLNTALITKDLDLNFSENTHGYKFSEFFLCQKKNILTSLHFSLAKDARDPYRCFFVISEDGKLKSLNSEDRKNILNPSVVPPFGDFVQTSADVAKATTIELYVSPNEIIGSKLLGFTISANTKPLDSLYSKVMKQSTSTFSISKSNNPIISNVVYSSQLKITKSIKGNKSKYNLRFNTNQDGILFNPRFDPDATNNLKLNYEALIPNLDYSLSTFGNYLIKRFGDDAHIARLKNSFFGAAYPIHQNFEFKPETNWNGFPEHTQNMVNKMRDNLECVFSFDINTNYIRDEYYDLKSITVKKDMANNQLVVTARFFQVNAEGEIKFPATNKSFDYLCRIKEKFFKNDDFQFHEFMFWMFWAQHLEPKNDGIYND